MDSVDLERLGLNRNEARVYHALLLRGQATAQELVKALGVHRNIVYDNLTKLSEKGLVSFVNDDGRRKFIAERPAVILEYLETKRRSVDDEIRTAKTLVPQISQILATSRAKQEVSLFKGVAGLKRILAEAVQADESWCIGITNASVQILGETFWKNFNVKKRATKTREWLLWNSDFKNAVITYNPRGHNRLLPPALDQVTETLMFDGKVALMVYSAEPVVIVIENDEVFKTFRKHFDFLWGLSKDAKIRR